MAKNKPQFSKKKFKMDNGHNFQKKTLDEDH